jgi:hypothetical protein
MLHLNQDAVNKMYLVCDDILCIENPIYLFKFLNVQTKKEYFIELENELSLNPRGDLFTLTLPTDLDLKPGDYRYYVYESPLAGDRDIEDMRLLAPGKLEVATTAANETIYEQTGDDIVYRG